MVVAVINVSTNLGLTNVHVKKDIFSELISYLVQTLMSVGLRMVVVHKDVSTDLDRSTVTAMRDMSS
jgi:hypothetical protein